MVELVCEVRVRFLDEVFKLRLVNKVKFSHLFLVVTVLEVRVTVREGLAVAWILLEHHGAGLLLLSRLVLDVLDLKVIIVCLAAFFPFDSALTFHNWTQQVGLINNDAASSRPLPLDLLVVELPGFPYEHRLVYCTHY